jgi:hypothetical protein
MSAIIHTAPHQAKVFVAVEYFQSSPSTIPRSLSPHAHSTTGFERSLENRVQRSTSSPLDLDRLRTTLRLEQFDKSLNDLIDPLQMEVSLKKAEELSRINQKFSVDLDQVIIHDTFRNKSSTPVTIDDYKAAIRDQQNHPETENLMTKLVKERASIRITLREAFYYVTEKVDGATTSGSILYLRDDQLLLDLTTIPFTDLKSAKYFPIIAGHCLNWLNVICEMLKSSGKIQDYSISASDARIVPVDLKSTHSNS